MLQYESNKGLFSCVGFVQVVFKKVAANETYRHCYRPLVQTCDGDADRNKTTCIDWPETICSTRYVEVPFGT